MGQREEIEKAARVVDFNELIREREHIQQRLEARQRLYTMYMAVATVVAASGLFFLTYQETPRDSAKEQQLQTEVDGLNTKINALQSSIDKASEQNDAALAAQVQAVNGRVDSLSATILEDPDKALTSRLLREKQANLEETVKDLKADNASTRGYLMGLVGAILALPILSNIFMAVGDRIAKRDKSENVA